MLEGGKPPPTMLILIRNALFFHFFSGGLWTIFEHLPPNCSKTIFVHLQLVPVGQEIVKLQSSFDRATAAVDKARLRHGNTGASPLNMWSSHQETPLVQRLKFVHGVRLSELHCISVHIQGRSHPRYSFEMEET